MRKLLFITTALVAFAGAAPAKAAPVGAWVATAIFGAGAAGTAAFTVVSSVVAMAASAALSMVVQALRGKPKQEAQRAELSRPTSLPAYRYVYGKTWAPGTPVGWKVRGRSLYICYLLNSRPSAGPFTVYLDKRQVDLTGDPFDFDGDGANGTNWPFGSGSNGPHVWIWIGDGSQTKCPDYIVANSGGYFSAADAWRGRTVLWARFRLGSDDDRQERWPSSPPELNVDGNWSLVEDPRTGSTGFSRNQALIVLDALRNNPVRPYGDDYLRLDTFEWAADVAGQAVPVKAGGSIPRYRADGILIWSDGSEIEDQLQPLLDAGASRFSRVGGKLAIIPAVVRPSVRTITDFTDGQALDLVRWKSSDDLYTEVIVTYPAPDRAYESAETPVYVIPGAQAQDGGVAKRLALDLDFVTDYRQAERVGKIFGMRSRMQRQVGGELFPDCFDLVSGSVCTLALPAPYGAWNISYEIQSIEPAAGLNDDESIVLRLPAVLTETSDAIYAWDPATEEQDVVAGSFDASRGKVQPPPSITLTTGNAAVQTSGDAVIPGVLGAWTASASASASGYEWEWNGGFPTIVGWRSGGRLDAGAADDDGVYSVSIPWVEIGEPYRIRVRTIGTYGASDWLVSSQITAVGPTNTIAAPPAPSAAPASASRINITAAQANDGSARHLLIYANDIDSPLTATLLDTKQAGASVTITTAETGLASGETRFYWSRARDQWGNLSDFSASTTATTP